MAITITNKGSVFTGSNATSYSTGSYTPTASRLLIATIVNELNTAGVDPAEPTVSGNGLTWSKIATYLPDTSGSKVRVSIWGALTGGSPSAGAFTADFGAETELGCNIIVDEVDGADLSGGTVASAIVQSVTGTVNGSGTSETITLSALGNANNASYGSFNRQTQEVMSAGTGYTILTQGNNAGPASSTMTEYKAPGSTTVDASWVTSGAKGGIAIEIKAAGGSTTTLTADNGSFADNGQAAVFSVSMISSHGSFS